MHVAIGPSHPGFEFKETMRAFLAAEHHEVVEVGTHSQDPADPLDYVRAVGIPHELAVRAISLGGHQ